VLVCSKHSRKRPIRLQHTRISLPRSTHVAAIVIYGVTLPGPFKRDTGKFPKIARRGCNLHISKALLSSRGPILASVSPFDPKSSREAFSRFRMPARPLHTQCVNQYLSILRCATRSERYNMRKFRGRWCNTQSSATMFLSVLKGGIHL